MRLALHLYQSPMDNESRLVRMARSIASVSGGTEVRLVGLQVDERSGLEQLEPGIVIDRVGSSAPKQDTLASRFTKVGGWYRQAYRAYASADLAVVSAHAVWALPLAFALSRASGAPVVYNPHELETRTPTMAGVKRLLAEQIESRLIRRCRLVTAVNDQIADWYQRRYRIARPVVVYNYPSATADRPARDLRGELGLGEDEVLFVHTGNLTGGRNIELILEAFEREARHHVLFVGAGELLPLVERSASRSDVVHHLAPVPPDEVVSLVRGADLALSLIETKATSYAWSSPNKLFEALAAGVAPLCSDLPEARKRLGGLAGELVLGSPAQALPAFLRRIDRATALGYRERLAPLPTWEEGVQPLLDAYRRLF